MFTKVFSIPINIIFLTLTVLLWSLAGQIQKLKFVRILRMNPHLAGNKLRQIIY